MKIKRITTERQLVAGTYIKAGLNFFGLFIMYTFRVRGKPRTISNGVHAYRKIQISIMNDNCGIGHVADHLSSNDVVVVPFSNKALTMFNAMSQRGDRREMLNFIRQKVFTDEEWQEQNYMWQQGRWLHESDK